MVYWAFLVCRRTALSLFSAVRVFESLVIRGGVCGDLSFQFVGSYRKLDTIIRNYFVRVMMMW